jgi:hypothetical protein
MNFCEYYQAHVRRDGAGMLVSVLRSFEHVVFDRTIDKASSLFEFFVPSGQERIFLEIMEFFQNEGIIVGLVKKENRLKDPNEIL